MKTFNRKLASAFVLLGILACWSLYLKLIDDHTSYRSWYRTFSQFGTLFFLGAIGVYSLFAKKKPSEKQDKNLDENQD